MSSKYSLKKLLRQDRNKRDTQRGIRCLDGCRFVLTPEQQEKYDGPEYYGCSTNCIRCGAPTLMYNQID